MDLYIDRPASLLEGVYPLGSKQDGKRNIKTWLQKSPRPKPWPSSTNKAARCTARMTIPFQPRATTKYLPRYFTRAFVKVVSIHPSPTSTIRAEETVRADLHTKNGTSTGPTGHPITNIKLPHVGGHEGIGPTHSPRPQLQHQPNSTGAENRGSGGYPVLEPRVQTVRVLSGRDGAVLCPWHEPFAS